MIAPALEALLEGVEPIHVDEIRRVHTRRRALAQYTQRHAHRARRADEYVVHMAALDSLLNYELRLVIYAGVSSRAWLRVLTSEVWP